MAEPTAHDGGPGRRAAGAFFLRLVLWYAVLAAPWPGVAGAYAAVYCGVANAVFGDFGRGEVRFRPTATGHGRLDVDIGLRRGGAAADAARAPHSSRVTGFLPTAELAALVLASPIQRRRKVRALGWGMLALHLFLLGRLWIMLLSWFAQDSPWQTLHPGSATSAFLALATEVLVVSPTPSFLVPLVIWLPVTFRRADLAVLAARPGAV